MTRRIRLDHLRAGARNRPPGYLAACHAAGRIDGEHLVIEPAPYQALRRRYRGLGDRLHDLLQPAAKIIDRLLRTHFARGCGGCARRQAWLNRVSDTWRAWMHWG